MEIVQNVGKSAKEIVIVSRKGKQGIGSAIREGIKNSSKDAILIATAEISEDPIDLAKMIDKMDDAMIWSLGIDFTKMQNVKVMHQKNTLETDSVTMQ